MKYTLLSAVLVLTAPSASAGTLACGGAVEKLAYHAASNGAGTLMLKLSSMNAPVFICTPDAEWIVAGSGYKTQPGSCSSQCHAWRARADSRN